MVLALVALREGEGPFWVTDLKVDGDASSRSGFEVEVACKAGVAKWWYDSSFARR